MLGVSVVKTSITPSGSFSVETLIGLTPSWKTELNRSISVIEDRIPGGLQHCHKTCCEKGGCRGRWACIFLEVTSLQGYSFLDRWTCI